MAFPRTRAERLWTGTVGAILAVLVGGSVLAPDLVYVRFVWQYFWGPVVADGHNAAAVAWNGGELTFFETTAAAVGASGPVAYPGYTIVSEIGYAITLLISLGGVVFLLDRLDFEMKPTLLYPLVPIMFFGGALRVLEDAHDAIPAGTGFLEFPLTALLISPLIYVTVFVVAISLLILAIRGRSSGYVDTIEWPIGIGGSVLTLIAFGYLAYLAVITDAVEFHPAFTALTIGIASLIAGVGWWAIRRYLPVVAEGTPLLGAVILWAHSIDGVANVLGIDWGAELGLVADLVPKHPANRGIIAITDAIVPEAITAVIGVAWGFLLVKVVAAVGVTWLFDEKMIEESPRFSTLLLIAVVAVGLGPGVRDMLRATFGV